MTLDYEYDDILRSGFSIIQNEYNSGKKLDIKNRNVKYYHIHNLMSLKIS